MYDASASLSLLPWQSHVCSPVSPWNLYPCKEFHFVLSQMFEFFHNFIFGLDFSPQIPNQIWGEMTPTDIKE